MASEYVSLRNLKFLLYEVLDAEKLTEFEFYKEHGRDTFDMSLDAARQISNNLLFPYYTEMDEKPPKLEDGTIKVHPGVRDIMEAFGEGGWISAPKAFDKGGQQMPITIFNAAGIIFHCANTSAVAYPLLTAGAANLIDSFGSDELKQTYLEPMFAGKWQGTMALTEPNAGSSLGDLTTSARQNDDGSYSIKGQKIYISGGDHDGVDNVVHLMLARIDGAPAGTKGISLFVVPKKRPEGGGLVDNDVITAGKYGKLGIKACPIAHLSMGEADNCKGWLVGEPNMGLKYMFQMMNEARLGVGMISTGVASGAYYASLQYANERPQGRPLSDPDPTKPPTLIINHADVKRLLLFQKAVAEGSTALLLQCSWYVDMIEMSEGEEQEKYQLLLDLLTPIAKTYPAEMCVLSTSAGIQVLGGAGYCDDFPLQQYFRDARINPIYEGTTAIQGLDLLGRKVPKQMGKSLILLGQEMQDTIAKANNHEVLKTYAGQLAKAQEMLTEITMHLMNLAQSEKPEVFLADASLYLEYAGYLVLGWQWLVQGIAAAEKVNDATGDDKAFYEGKLATLQYFYEYELPKTGPLHRRLASEHRLTLDLDPEYLV